jgi:hypothetical protein
LSYAKNTLLCRRAYKQRFIFVNDSGAPGRKQNWGVLANTFKEVTGDEDMPTMVEIWKAEGRAEGRAEEKTEARREMLLEFLRGKFGKVPKNIERAINQMNDPIALKSLAVRTGNCKTLAEFAEEL